MTVRVTPNETYLFTYEPPTSRHLNEDPPNKDKVVEKFSVR